MVEVMLKRYLQSVQFQYLSIPLKDVFVSFDINRCDLLKIDVEGFECQVLESLGELLKPSTVGAVAAEYGLEGMRVAGKTGWNVVELMLSRGYKCCELRTGREICKSSDVPILPDYTVTDFLFLSVFQQ